MIQFDFFCIFFILSMGFSGTPKKWDPLMVSGTHTIPISLGIRKCEWYGNSMGPAYHKGVPLGVPGKSPLIGFQPPTIKVGVHLRQVGPVHCLISYRFSPRVREGVPSLLGFHQHRVLRWGEEDHRRWVGSTVKECLGGWNWKDLFLGMFIQIYLGKKYICFLMLCFNTFNVHIPIFGEDEPNLIFISLFGADEPNLMFIPNLGEEYDVF